MISTINQLASLFGITFHNFLSIFYCISLKIAINLFELVYVAKLNNIMSGQVTKIYLLFNFLTDTLLPLQLKFRKWPEITVVRIIKTV